jgi:hypothetical protein
MKLSNSTNKTKTHGNSSRAKSLSSQQMRKLWDAEIAKAWQEMQNAIALNQSETSC